MKFLFESHITVEPNETFQSVCKELNVLSLLIGEDTGSALPEQMMTKKFHHCPAEQAKAETIELADELESRGLKVIRVKLERIHKENASEYLYSEFHLKVDTTEESFPSEIQALGGKTSKNLWRDSKYQFATFRDKNLFEAVLPLIKQKYKVISLISEEVILDTNPDIDSHWICSCPLKEVSLN